jgi:hypothetical protein
MEASTNVRYILADNRNSRFLAWLRYFLAQDLKQINNWAQALSNYPDNETEVHWEGTQRRRLVWAQREKYVKRLEQEFENIGVNRGDEIWPNSITRRFEAIGESVSYRTAYARMSSQTHADAEDTISYFSFKALGDEQLLTQMSLETLAFSEYLVHYGAHFYLEALARYSVVFADSTAEKIRKESAFIITQVETIGNEWGW